MTMIDGVDETSAAAARADRRRQWLERAGRELELAEAWEPANDPQRLADRLDRMVEISANTGALVGDVDDRGWKSGQTIDVKIGVDPGRLYPDKMVVVRYMAEQKQLAFRARRFASVLMQVKRDCDRLGVEPA